MLKSEIEAEELEKKAKEEMKNRNYKSALEHYEEAREIYVQLNYRGKIIFIEKQLVQLRRVIEFEKEKGVTRKPVTEKKKLDDEIMSEHLSKKASEIRNISVMNKRDLSSAEIRRTKLREKAEAGERKMEIKRTSDAKIYKREQQRKIDLKEGEKELKVITEKKKGEEKIKDKADWALEQAKVAIKLKQFDKAKTHYKEAIELFRELRWFDQVGILYDEIKNVDKYKLEHQKNLKFESIQTQRAEEQFQKRANGILAEKRQEEQRILARIKALPPELRIIMEKVKMLKEKAEKEEKINIKRAIGRYQYILELYKSIPNDKIDLTNDISQIKKKIPELEAKM